MSENYFNAIQALGCETQVIEDRAKCKRNCCAGDNCMAFFEKQFRRSSMVDGIEDDRLRAIAEAERDGSVVVLPCKVGDTVVLPVAVGTPVYVYFGIPNVSPIDGGIFEYIGEQIEEHEFEMDMLDCWGKNIFATRAEAAAALASAGKGE